MITATRNRSLQIQQETLPGGPIGAGGGRDQLAPTPYQLPQLARQEGCCYMSCDCLSKYHGRASRDAPRVWSGWASTVIQAALRAGLRAALRAGLRAALRTGPPGHATRRAAGPCYASGRWAALRVGPPGRATRRAAGRAPRRTNYSATAPLDLRTNGRTTPIHTNGHQ